MSDPIDILQVASDLVGEAATAVRTGMALNHSDVARRFLDNARARWAIAANDYKRAKELMMELS